MWGDGGSTIWQKCYDPHDSILYILSKNKNAQECNSTRILMHILGRDHILDHVALSVLLMVSHYALTALLLLSPLPAQCAVHPSSDF